MNRKFTLLLMLVLNVLVLNAQDVAGPNIISNSTFDTNDAGWSNYFDYAWAPNDPLAAKGSVSVVTKAGYTGNAYKVSITECRKPGLFCSNNLPHGFRG